MGSITIVGLCTFDFEALMEMLWENLVSPFLSLQLVFKRQQSHRGSLLAIGLQFNLPHVPCLLLSPDLFLQTPADHGHWTFAHTHVQKCESMDCHIQLDYLNCSNIQGWLRSHCVQALLNCQTISGFQGDAVAHGSRDRERLPQSRPVRQSLSSVRCCNDSC